MILLFEIGTEELPAGEIAPALAAMARHLTEGAANERLTIGAVETFATPRRLALRIHDIADVATTVEETVLGPAARIAFDADGNPTKAALGFARGKGLAPEQLLRIETDKGEYVGAVVRNEGRPAADILGELLTSVFAAIPWKRSMKWGWGDETFARPVHWIVALLDEHVLPVAFAGVESGRESMGHRFLANHAVTIPRPDGYADALAAAYVVADIDVRKRAITTGLQALVADGHHRIVQDDALLDEVAQLVEWPVPLLGTFPEALLEVPREVLVTSMGTHQRYFAVERPDGTLANQFAFVSNMVVEDPSVVIAGNLRVLLARLEDAKFFYREDAKLPLTERSAKLRAVRYIDGLGSVQDRVDRIVTLAGALAERLYPGDASVAAHASRAAALCKADLTTGMVYEFPELQGTMGRYYATAQGEPAEVADAIEQHYRPAGASDAVPSTPAAVVVAIADKLDALIGCFALGLIPSGSADPYALRRAALGILRTVLDHGHRVDLETLLATAYDALPQGEVGPREATVDAAHAFVMARLRAMLASDAPVDVVDAVLAVIGEALPSAPRRIAAVVAMRGTEGFDQLAEAFRRSVNIVRKAVEAGDAPAEWLDTQVDADPALLVEPAERALYEAVTAAAPRVHAAVATDAYEEAASALIALKAPIDAFFDAVMVNVEDDATRRNRQRLLSMVRETFVHFADIGRIQVG